MRNLGQDLRFSVRQMSAGPGFTLTAVLSLALGIGSTTAVFSIIYAALINPYPYPAADRIVRLAMESKAGVGEWVNVTGRQVTMLQQSPVVGGVLAMDFHLMSLTGREFPENVREVGLIAGGFQDLGVPPFLGRGLVASDSTAGQEPQPVTLISYEFWQKHYLSNPDAVGKKLELDHRKYLIVGVAAPRFTWYVGDVYLPLKLTGDPAHTLIVDLRLKPGVTQRAANAALQPLVEQFAREMPSRYPQHFSVQVQGLNEWVVKSMGGTLYLLLGAVALLLAIGCGNVSILLLARGAARQQELAIRSAIGADRMRIVGQLLTESMLLAAIGAVLGIVMSYAILAGIKALLPRYAFAPEVVIGINVPVLFFSVAVALGTGIVFGLWPALSLARQPLNQTMQFNARRVAGSVRSRRTHAALIAGQIALTMVMLTGAGAAMKGFLRLIRAPLGYDPQNVMSIQVPLHDNSYITWAAREAYFEALRDKISGTAGVTSAAVSSNATPPRSGWNGQFELMGRTARERPLGSINLVSPEYFGTLRIPLLQGRLWDQTENHRGAFVSVVNQTFARRYFPKGDALGHALRLPSMQDSPPVVVSAPHLAQSWLAIVGVVEDARNDGLRNPTRPGIYVPYTLSMDQGTQILVRSASRPLSLVPAVRKQIAKVDPEQQIFAPDDLVTWISNEPEWQQEHLAAWIFGFFAALALILAAVGLYSVVSYTVAQRTGEFGIRIALGAESGHLLRTVFASTLVSVGTGIAAGLALALGLSSVLENWVGGSSRDPVSLLAGSVLLCLVAAAACAIPARHALRIDPMTALRFE